MAEGSKFDMSLLKRLFRYIRPYRLVFIPALIFMILFAMAEAFRPYLILEMINRFVTDSGGSENSLFQLGDYVQNFILYFQPDMAANKQLLAWTMLVVIILIIEAILQFSSTYLSNFLGQSIIRDVRMKLYKHIDSFKLKYFDRTPIGTIVTRMISDIEAIAEVFSIGLITMLGDILKLILIIGLMFTVSWELTLMALIPIPLLLIATRIFARAMKKAFQKERVQVNKLNTFVQEHISGMSIVQLFNRQNEEYSRFQSINKDHRQAHVDAIWANSIFFPVVELLSSLSIAMLIMWGMLQLNYSEETVGGVFGIIFAFIIWIHMLYRPIRQLADRFNILQRGMVRAERVFAVLDREEHIDSSGTLKDVDFNQSIRFENLWFAYQDDEWVLKGINLEVKSGKAVALVGSTGAGKSTIINLLTRFYEYQKGDIKIGEHSIRDIELNTLRKNIGIVLQDVFLFSDTIMNNITLGDKSITRDQVIDAAKKVGAHDFISKLPGGYDFNVKERGGVLSVGQRQLISIIRAYVYNPGILILDEATASVDTESEELIQKATAELQKGRTSIVIAHRLSTIVNSDEILVIDNGNIIERGNHNELLKLDGQYKKLYELNYA